MESSQFFFSRLTWTFWYGRFYFFSCFGYDIIRGIWELYRIFETWPPVSGSIVKGVTNILEIWKPPIAVSDKLS